MSDRRVAITGIGLISPLGIGTSANWKSLLEGRSGIGPICRFDATDFPTQIAGEVRGFDPSLYFSKKYVRQMDLFIQYAVAASFMAIEDSGLDQQKPNPERAGVFVGAGLGGISLIEATHDTLREKGPRHGISPYFVPAIIINLAAGQVSLFHNFQGPSFSHVSACSTGAHSIGEAFRTIQRGDVDIMLAGGTESTVTPLGIGGFNAARALSTRNAEPTKASRPFTLSRDGFVLSEGAGILVLEELGHAKARGATVYAELAGYSATCDAYHITSTAPEGIGAQRCMRLALQDAKIAPEQVGYINAHGTSTAADATESFAIRQVFGAHSDNGLMVSSTKSMHGHLLGAAGGLEAAITCLVLRHGAIPPTINLDDPDPECDLDFVPHRSRQAQVEYAVSNNYGFGGTNVSLVFKKSN